MNEESERRIGRGEILGKLGELKQSFELHKAMPGKTKKNNGLAPVLTVASFLMVVIIAITGVMGTQISSQEKAFQRQIAALEKGFQHQLDETEKKIEKHAETQGHPWLVTQIAVVKERQEEKETQFRNLDERTQRMEKHTATEFAAFDTALQREIGFNVQILDERIRAMCGKGIK